GASLVLQLEKFSGIEWWDCVVKGHPTIDVTKIEPENSSLKDLDPETRAMVEKMMFDQRQRMMNLPDSEALKKQEVLEKFKKAVSTQNGALFSADANLHF
ncbi:transcriptional coactivator, partial [Massospora cicadina]